MHRTSFNDPNHAHYLTFSRYRKRQFLTTPEAQQWLAESLEFARKTRKLDIWAYVFMPEHIHLLLHPKDYDYAMASILRDIKESFSRRLVRHWRETNDPKLTQSAVKAGQRVVHRIWQPGGGFDRNLYNRDAIRRAIAYIEYNPVRRGLVVEAHDWQWSSARAHLGYSDVPITIDTYYG